MTTDDALAAFFATVVARVGWTDVCVVREHAPGGFAALFPPAACFSRSTSVFHFLTISFASSETGFDACWRSFPTARPALLS